MCFDRDEHVERINLFNSDCWAEGDLVLLVLLHIRPPILNYTVYIMVLYNRAPGADETGSRIDMGVGKGS